MNATAFRARLEEAEEVTTWPTPDMSMLAAGRSSPPKMSGELFGSTWPLINDLAEGAGSPVDYVAIGVLTVAASLIGGKRRVRPFDTSDWAEPCILWSAAVGDPSANKSPAIDAATKPLNSMEGDHADSHKANLQDFEARLERAKAERKAWEDQVKAATKAGEDTPPLPDAAIIPDTPERKRLVIMDATPEKVGAILADNPFGTFHLRDELAGWLMSFDRYSPGGREFWLEAYGGRPHIIDRKSLSKPIRVPFNGVTVLGGIQPEKLSECILKCADDGLVARFLWAWPDPIPYRRPRRIADADQLDRTYRRLEQLPTGLDAHGNPCALTLPLTAKAADIFEAWLVEHTASIGDAGSLYKGFCGKLKGMALRIALVSELLWWAHGNDRNDPREVSAEALTAALEFVESYAKPAALRVFGDAALPVVERNAAALARTIQRRGATLINARDVQRQWGIPNLKEAGPLDEALSHLVEADWLRPAPTRAGRSPGRARKDFEVNPAVHVVPHG